MSTKIALHINEEKKEANDRLLNVYFSCNIQTKTNRLKVLDNPLFVTIEFKTNGRRDTHALIGNIPLRTATSYGNHLYYPSSIKNTSFLFQYTPMRVNIKHQQPITFSNT